VAGFARSTARPWRHGPKTVATRASCSVLVVWFLRPWVVAVELVVRRRGSPAHTTGDASRLGPVTVLDCSVCRRSAGTCARERTAPGPVAQQSEGVGALAADSRIRTECGEHHTWNLEEGSGDVVGTSGNRAQRGTALRRIASVLTFRVSLDRRGCDAV
jgi:hypothetical protein